MTRFLALLVAAGLVVGALVVRAAIDDDDDTGDGDGRTTLVVCAEELASACDALDADYDVRVEDAADTADRVAGSAATDVDVWVTTSPWPAMVDDVRARAGLDPRFAASPTAAGRTRLAVVGPADLEGCDWRCLGERAADDLRLGSRPLGSTGLGVLTVAAAAAGWFGSPAFATNDFDAEFDRWLAGFAAGVEASSGPVRQLLQSRAFFDAAIDLEATAATALASASADRSAGLTLQYPAPVATIEAVVARVGAGAPDDIVAVVSEHLRELGWEAASDGPTGLPSAGVLIALRDRV